MSQGVISGMNDSLKLFMDNQSCLHAPAIKREFEDLEKDIHSHMGMLHEIGTKQNENENPVSCTYWLGPFSHHQAKLKLKSFFILSFKMMGCILRKTDLIFPNKYNI